MVEIQSTIEKIETADTKLDSNNTIDEQKIIDKINQTKEYFEKFEKTKLVEMKDKLSTDEYKNLKDNFDKLKQGFWLDLELVSKKLTMIDELKEEEYSQIIIDMEDNFWWLLEIKSWDKIWDLAVKYLWLPQNWKLANYSWFQLTDWIEKHQDIDQNKLQIWNLLMLPAEYTILKDIIKNNDYIEVEKLLEKEEISYKEKYKELSELDKVNIKKILIKYFDAKWNEEQSKIIMDELEESYFKWLTKEEIKKAKEIATANPIFYKEWLIQYDPKNLDYWIWEYPQWLKDGFLYWSARVLNWYHWLLSWELKDKILKWLEELWNDPMWTLWMIWDELWNEIKNIADFDIKLPHSVWSTIWALLTNILIWVFTWWIVWKLVWVSAKTLSKLSKIKWLESIQKISNKISVDKSKEFTNKVTWWINIKKLETIKNFNKEWFKTLWIESMYHSWNWILMTTADTLRTIKILKWVKWINIDGVKQIVYKWNTVLKVDKATFSAELIQKSRRLTDSEIKEWSPEFVIRALIKFLKL